MRIPVDQPAAYPHGLLFLRADAALDYDAKKAGAGDVPLRDKDTGHPITNVLVLNPLAERRDEYVLTVKVASPFPPKVPDRILVPVVFTELQLTPYVTEQKRQGMSLRATDVSPVQAAASK